MKYAYKVKVDFDIDNSLSMAKIYLFTSKQQAHIFMDKIKTEKRTIIGHGIENIMTADEALRDIEKKIEQWK